MNDVPVRGPRALGLESQGAARRLRGQGPNEIQLHHRSVRSSSSLSSLHSFVIVVRHAAGEGEA